MVRIQNYISLALGPLLFVAVINFFNPEGITVEAKSVFAVTLWMSVWWITEAVPISVTAMLPILLFPLTGALDIASTTASYGHKYIFLFIGGFMIAITIEKWGLHKRIALLIIKMIGTEIKLIILGFMIATAFMSMWISNTATVVMMLPIGAAVISQLNDNPNTHQNENVVFGKALMLSIAYAASIGGIATLIGTPPNLILAGVAEEILNIEITFLHWFKLGLPISILLLCVCWWYLTNFAFKFTDKPFYSGQNEIDELLMSLGKLSNEEKKVLIVFILTALLWMLRPLVQKLIPEIDDTMIAMIMGMSLFIIPAKEKNAKLLNWEEAVKMPWGILILFGGGIALAEGFITSGLAEWIGNQFSIFSSLHLVLLLLITILIVNFLTEITSNLATTAMLLPILAPLAVGIGVDPLVLMVAATTAASCAFMLPVATPPNAVVFGSGYLKISDMVRAGVWMNIISILILTIIMYGLLPLIW
ncbi:MAG: DASS family sodium-coupled anion symporter [Chitinophagales bacterium]|nr:DASS family sodium-coupled anion symporter [Chitinophagales bacterium]